MDDDPQCPKCGSDLISGYGLAGGGVGPYEICNNPDCDHFTKTQDEVEEEPNEAR